MKQEKLEVIMGQSPEAKLRAEGWLLFQRETYPSISNVHIERWAKDFDRLQATLGSWAAVDELVSTVKEDDFLTRIILTPTKLLTYDKNGIPWWERIGKRKRARTRRAIVEDPRSGEAL
ncbi:MAG: hypothetical protein QNJ16_21380 [Rhodobacter sp.]|nr:hypothetical protein [Rhodobacter sp.]